MPVITGVVGSGLGPPDGILRAMMSALARHEIDGARTECLGSAHFGVQFHHTLPEDDLDRQPYVGGGRRYLVVADARVDNREELAAELAIAGPELRALSDAELLTRGWEKWALGLFERLLGDVALAIWDDVRGELILARGPLSSRPIFFSQSADSAAFASLPSALCAVPAIGASPDLEEIARFLGGGLFQANGRSFFRGIRQVPQGQAIVLKNGSLSVRRLWSPGGRSLGIGVGEAGDLIRHELDRAATAQARRRSAPLACMLSSGRDSSAVLAALAQSESINLVALTAAPGSVIDGLPTPWIAQESDIAERTAQHLQVRQISCRSVRSDLCSMLDDVSAAHFQPFNNPVNLPWIAQLSRTAKEAGAAVMMTGAAGNFTVSLGGPSFLPDFWREHGFPRWLRLAQEIRRNAELNWPEIAAYSFGSLVPARPYSWLRKAAGRQAFRTVLPLLRGAIRRDAEAYRATRFADARHKPRRRAYLSTLVQGIEPGDKYSLACWGVDVRDPTADRRLAETCLSLPIEALLGSSTARPAYRHAFEDRLPAEVLEGRHLGAQAADWFETIRPEDVLAAYRHHGRNPIVAELFDMTAIETMIERWPRSAAAADALYDEYCNQLLGGLAVASFINCHFAG